MNREILHWLAGREAEMLALLREMVLIQSGSRNKPGVDRVGRLIAATLGNLGLDLVTVPQEDLGDVLIASTPAAGDRDNLLLIGHMDTVFPAETDFNWYREDETRAFGPGVADMKGGLVAGIYALKALEARGELAGLPLRFIFNPDEEIGSPVSGPIIAAEARRSIAALVLECGSLTGGVVTGRKGRLGLDLRARGLAGHAAFAGPDKASAILELAHKIIGLEALNGLAPGLTVNVGVVQGGIGPNTVAEAARAAVDVRFARRAEAELFRAEMERIVAARQVPGTAVEVEVVSHRPPMEQSAGNRALYEVVADQARSLGLPVEEEFRPGGSDANIVAAEGRPAVDGLGPLGDQDHSDREYIIKSSLVERAQLLALSIRECWQRHKAGQLFPPAA